MYAKVFDSILDSSIMEEDVTTRLVFFYLLALADPDGVVDVTEAAIARRCNLAPDIVERACKNLNRPDPGSRSDEEGGRRIVPLDGQSYGWLIVNYRQYRSMRTNADRREYFREYRRKRRAEGKDLPKKADVHGEQGEHGERKVNTSPSPSLSVVGSSTEGSSKETVKAKPNSPTKVKQQERGHLLSVLEEKVPGFSARWESWMAVLPTGRKKTLWGQVLTLREFLEFAEKFRPTEILDMLSTAERRTWTGFDLQWWKNQKRRDEKDRQPSPYRTE